MLETTLDSIPQHYPWSETLKPPRVLQIYRSNYPHEFWSKSYQGKGLSGKIWIFTLVFRCTISKSLPLSEEKSRFIFSPPAFTALGFNPDFSSSKISGLEISAAPGEVITPILLSISHESQNIRVSRKRLAQFDVQSNPTKVANSLTYPLLKAGQHTRYSQEEVLMLQTQANKDLYRWSWFPTPPQHRNFWLFSRQQ